MKVTPDYKKAVEAYDAAKKLRAEENPPLAINHKKMEKDLCALNAALLNAGKPKAGDSLIGLAFGLVVTVGLLFGIVWLMLEAAAREDEAREQTRAERCARMGENAPPEFLEYCRGLQ